MPASYPTSAKAFTTKSDGPGNTILAAHINDLQAEVTAVETDLIAGLPVARGGTGNTTLTANRVLLGDGTSAIAVAGAGTSGQVLTSNGASAPTFQTPTSAGPVFTYTGGNGGTQAQATTSYYNVGFQNTTAASVENVVPTDVTITKLYVRTDAAVGGAGQTVTFTLYKNGSATAITCSIASGASTGNDTAHSVSFAAGDRIALEVVTSATTGTVQIRAAAGA